MRAAAATRAGLALCAALQLAACATSRSAGLRAVGASGAAHEGFDAWLRRGDVTAAQGAFGAALQEDERDPWALTGLAMLARRGLDPRAEGERLLAVVRAAPDGAVGLAALERLAELARVGPDVDAAIERGLAPLAEAGKLRGVAAFRARVARIAAAEASGDVAAVTRLRQEYGAATEWTLVGPFSPLGALDFDAPLPVDRGLLPQEAPVVPGAPPSPARRIPTPDGVLRLPDGSADGVHLLGSDVRLSRGGRYLVVLWTPGSAKVLLDGATVAERRDFARFEPATLVAEVELGAGLHRVAVRFSPDGQSRSLLLGLARADGAPSDTTWTATPPGPVPALVPGGPPARPWTAETLARALEQGGGRVLGRLLAARAMARLDREGAKALLAEAAAAAPEAAPVRVTLAVALADDPTLDRRVARSRAEAELQRALARDPGDGEARLELSALLRGSDRPADAEDVLAGLPPALADRPAALTERAAVARSRGERERADAVAADAAAAGSCEARAALLDSAAAREAIADLDALARASASCPGGRERLLRHLERRGELAAALEVAAPLAEARPADLDAGLTRSALRASAGDLAGALRELGELTALWPSARLWKRAADLRELAGDRAGAREARERALALDGGDLELRRALALEDGGEVLDELREAGAAALRAYEAAGAAGAARDTSTALVLDAAAQVFHPGGAITDRTHQIVHVLDQRGVDRYGEAQLPSGAQVLTLRTRKPDGRTLEPHAGEGKGSISLAGLEPGDYVEVEYLRATRGGPEGHAADPFYFQEEGERLVHSTYTVVAPVALGIEVDAHGMEPPALERSGDHVTLRVQRTDVPAIVAEPGAPRRQEFLPAVQVGFGAGRDALQRRMAEAVAPRTRTTLELGALAREIRGAAGKGADPEALVRAAWAIVAARVAGGPGGLADDASEVLSRGRGSRTILLKAILDALGIPSRVALVRTFEVDPRPYRFPRHNQYPQVLLRVTLPAGGALWLDPGAREAPFGSLPAEALDAEALILPAPGEPLEVARTPEAARIPSARASTIRIELDGRGDATIAGEDRYGGHTAGTLRAALERFDAPTRRRIFQQSIASTFRGGVLDALELRGAEDREAEVAVRYGARVPALARSERGGLVVEAPILPAKLRESFVRLAERRLPLYVGPQDPLVQRVEVVAPDGLAPVAAPPIALESPWGRYSRRERVEGRTLIREERIEITPGRVSPDTYADFAAFISSIDAAQEAPIRLGGERNPGGPS